EGQYTLAYMYYNGEGTAINKEQAFYWYRRLAEKGYASPQFNIALMYYHGEGTTMNKKLAAFWMKKSYENGSEGAKEAWDELELSKY
ncbi:MAG: tetratricopeptide repeat protein, partial [Candidatus Marinimicrobia bacterium]|nr:tetratricopeptide repeat protein [Candidatus Neomarinimicrobiota bacterium]